MISSAFKSDWSAVTIAAVGLALTFGARGLAIWLAEGVDRYNFERRTKTIEL
jgi:CHASE1-domain containing sensor protein